MTEKKTVSDAIYEVAQANGDPSLSRGLSSAHDLALAAEKQWEETRMQLKEQRADEYLPIIEKMARCPHCSICSVAMFFVLREHNTKPLWKTSEECEECEEVLVRVSRCDACPACKKIAIATLPQNLRPAQDDSGPGETK